MSSEIREYVFTLGLAPFLFSDKWADQRMDFIREDQKMLYEDYMNKGWWDSIRCFGCGKGFTDKNTLIKYRGILLHTDYDCISSGLEKRLVADKDTGRLYSYTPDSNVPTDEDVVRVCARILGIVSDSESNEERLLEHFNLDAALPMSAKDYINYLIGEGNPLKVLEVLNKIEL